MNGPRRMLHVLNGDATREKLEASAVPGTFAVWADVLHEGPIPASEAADAERRETRAHYIDGAGYATYEQALDLYRRWDEALDRYPDHDEVVLWCEHDLFDQLLLIRHLDWFGRRASGDVPLSLICIGSYPGRPEFKGLGELEPAELESLLGARQRVSPAQIDVARAAWQSFVSPDPREIESLLRNDTAALPFLRRSLGRYLEEFPSARDGLSRTQRTILQLLGDGPLELNVLFSGVHRAEDAFYIGDGSFLNVISALAAGPHPLVEVELRDGTRPGLPDGVVRLTSRGDSVLRGREAGPQPLAVAGSPHLRYGAAWRWDTGTGRLVGYPHGTSR